MKTRDYRPRRRIPDDLIYAVIERFMREPGPGKTAKYEWNAKTLAEWLTGQGHDTNREEIFPLVRHAITRGFIRLHPPRSYTAKTMLGEKFPNMPADTKIVDVKPPFIGENLASTTASMLLRLIRTLGPIKEEKFNKETAPSDRVHVGFGAGAMTMRVAEKLAQRMETEADLPRMTFHALSSGFSNSQPLSAPVAFFSAFSKLNQPIEFVGLFAPPFVKTEKYGEIEDLPAIKESFRESKKIDIVITSLAQADDEHGMLNSFLSMNTGGRPAPLVRAKHKGDVLWQPFSNDEALTDVDTGIRAVTLFDLPGLVRLANSEDKHVVLVAGPCSVCGKTKARALRPLLTRKSLRVSNHLVTDVATVREILDEGRPVDRPTEVERHVD